MSEIQYLVRKDSLSHAYTSRYAATYARKNYSPIKRHERYERTKEIVGRKAPTVNRYGNYKSPYYDPVARHERYEREKDHITRPYGVGESIGKSSGRSGSGSGGSAKGSGKGSGKRSGKAKGSSKAVANAIHKLREESSLNTDVQQEVARRKIEDLRERLKQKVDRLREDAYNKSQAETNVAEIRGITQTLRDKIQSVQGKTTKEINRVQKELGDWIESERESLNRRIATLQGTTYDPDATAKQKRQQAARNKKVKKRADAIYRRSKK